MSKRNGFAWKCSFALFAASLALAAGVAGAAENPGPAVTLPAASDSQASVSPDAPSTPLVETPLPIFNSTYVCSYEITGCGASGLFCTVVCNVGQNCHCVVTYGHLADGSCYVQRVSPGFCF
ncbi:MAG TPA: hypothetical protein VF173_00040 [Thermoanaerobaculia bacterium]|nr:hypothetical protein [Thermoanaerobaculia bacterium]